MQTYHQKYYQQHKEEFRKRSKTLLNRYSQGKYDASEHNRIWEITFPQYCELVNKNCHYCGKSLKDECGSGLDRINNSEGYTLKNVLPCCGFCNNLRGNRLTVQETEVVIKALLSYRETL